MNKNKSSLPYLIIAFLIYILEVGTLVYFGYYKVYPKIKASQEDKAQHVISQPILDKQAKVYDLVQKNKRVDAVLSAIEMLKVSNTISEKALGNQVVGEAYLYNNQYDKAPSYFDEAFKLRQDFPGVYLGFAKIQVYNKDYKTAVTNARKAIELYGQDSKSPEPYYYLCLALYGNNEREASLEAIDKAISLSPKDEYLKSFRLQILKFLNPSTTIPITSPIKTTQNKIIKNYSQSDIDYINNEISSLNNSLGLFSSLKYPDPNNQKTVDSLKNIVSERLTIANNLISKMNSKLVLTQNDVDSWTRFDSLKTDQANLSKSLPRMVK